MEHFFPGLRTTRLRIVPPCRQLVLWITRAVKFQVGVLLSVHKRTSRTSSTVLGRRRREFHFHEIVVEFLNGAGHPFYLVDFILMFMRPAAETGDVFGVRAIVPAITEDLAWSISSQVYARLV